MAVYADRLMEDDDPRGQLISMDLADVDVESAVWRSEREAAVRRWLGFLGSHPDVKTRLGLIQVELNETSYSSVRSLFLDAPSRFIEGIAMRGSKRFMRRCLDEILTGPYPWLGRISIVSSDTRDEVALTAETSHRLRTAAPALHTLYVGGVMIADDIADPGVTYLRVDGHRALPSFVDGNVFGSVVTLDLLLTFAQARLPPEASNIAISSAKFPGLEILDLCRNRDRRLREVCDVLDGSSIASQLRSLRLPVIRDAADLAAVDLTLKHLTRVEEVTVADCYRGLVPPVHRGLEVRCPTPKPWLHRDDVELTSMLELTLSARSFQVEIIELCHVLENKFSQLGEDSRSAWRLIWQRLLDDCMLTGSARIDGAVWRRAMEPCLDAFCSTPWRALIESCPLHSVQEVEVRITPRD